MSKNAVLVFGGLGSFIGLVIGVILELTSPNGFECFNTGMFLSSDPAASLLAFFQCWFIVLLFTGITGTIGAVIGAFFGD